jgi:hypothetical protein
VPNPFPDAEVTGGNSSNQNPVENRSNSVVEQTFPFDDSGELLGNRHFLEDREDEIGSVAAIMAPNAKATSRGRSRTQ